MKKIIAFLVCIWCYINLCGQNEYESAFLFCKQKSIEYITHEDWKSAILYEEATLRIIDSIYKGTDSLYIESFSNLYLCYSKLKNYKEAIYYGERLSDLLKNRLGGSDSLYRYYAENLEICKKEYIIDSLEKRRDFLIDCNTLDNELQYVCIELMNLYDDLYDTDNKKNIYNLYVLSIVSFRLCKYDDMHIYISKGLALIKANDYKWCAIFFQLLGNYHAIRLNYSDALKYYNAALNNAEASALDSLWTEIYIQKSIISAEIGDYREMATVYNMQLIRDKDSFYDTSYYSFRQEQVILYYIRYCLSEGFFEKAIYHIELLLHKQENNIGKNTINYALSLMELSNFYGNIGEYQDALNASQEAYDIVKKISSPQGVTTISVQIQMASHNAKLHNYDKSIEMYENILNNSNLGDDLYRKLIGNITWTSLKANNQIKFKEYAPHYIEMNNNFFLKNIETMSFQDRNRFIKKYGVWFYNMIPELCYNEYTNDTLLSLAYNNLLTSKNLVLAMDIEIKNLIKESEDTNLVNLYNLLIKNKENLDVNFDTDLEELIKTQETELITKSKIYGDYTKNMRIKWRDVQEKLRDKDIAVEFCSFDLNKDSTMYVALVLNKGMNAPQLVKLFEEKQLTKLNGATETAHKEFYDKRDASILVWKPIEEYLNGVENVYFSPSGEFYNIGIEYLPYWNDTNRMCDRYNLYRLSSTRELALIKDKSKIKTSAVYGGLNYDMDTTAMKDNGRQYNTRGIGEYSDINIDSLDRSGNIYYEYLPATRTEADKINEFLINAKVKNTLFTDTLGTETSFKDLSGKKINLIHIGTHGSYWTGKEFDFKNIENLSLFSMQGKESISSEDKALTRSYILFSGGNNIFLRKPIPENTDDGILTAKEISALDLRGCDLVTLSACQTGLGEIKGDGVFGLQRGFKKAGVNSLLMSLWKVNDNATQLLMTEFYRSLTSGQDKHTALKNAQNYLRNYTQEQNKVIRKLNQKTKRYETIETGEKETVKPYDKPEFWAAFILLDAID